MNSLDFLINSVWRVTAIRGNWIIYIPARPMLIFPEYIKASSYVARQKRAVQVGLSHKSGDGAPYLMTPWAVQASLSRSATGFHRH
jgi:hypothetical protein